MGTSDWLCSIMTSPSLHMYSQIELAHLRKNRRKWLVKYWEQKDRNGVASNYEKT